MTYRILSFLAIMLAAATARGQFTPSRFVTVAPKLRAQNDPAGARYLAQHGLWANLQKGFHSPADRFGWSITVGGMLEFVSWPGASLGMEGAIEMLADTRNDISFNPQGVNWEEGFIYNVQLGEIELGAGYLHRCMHNIDNLLTTNTDAQGMQRTLIFGSLTSRALLREFRVKAIGTMSAWLGADYYLVTEDYRYPEQQIKIIPDVEKLRFSVNGGFATNVLRFGSTSLYSRLGGKIAFFSDTTTSDYRAEFGLALSGEAMNMQVFFGAEGLSDDGGSVIPRSSDFFYIGLRFLGKNTGL